MGSGAILCRYSLVGSGTILLLIYFLTYFLFTYLFTSLIINFLKNRHSLFPSRIKPGIIFCVYVVVYFVMDAC